MPVRAATMCGALVIDSMPPATTTAAEPALIRSCPSMIAFMPEPHTLLMVVQPTAGGRPAPSDAWRAGAWPRLAVSTQPMITSLTSDGATPDCSSAARIAVAPSVGVGTPVNWPRKEPMAVRLAPAMTTSDMGILREAWGRACAPWTIAHYRSPCGSAANRRPPGRARFARVRLWDTGRGCGHGYARSRRPAGCNVVRGSDMKKELLRQRDLTLGIVVALALSACGGGGGNVRPAPPPSTP